MAEAVGAAFLYRKGIRLGRRRIRAIRQKSRDKGLAGLKGFFESSQEIRVPIVKAGEGADVKDNGLGRSFDAFFICDTVIANQPEIRDAVIFKRFNIHKRALQIALYAHITIVT